MCIEMFQICVDASTWESHLQGEMFDWNWFYKVRKNMGNTFLQEIDEMIHTVDKNEDGKISYSEFRVRKTCVFSRPGKARGWLIKSAGDFFFFKQNGDALVFCVAQMWWLK